MASFYNMNEIKQNSSPPLWMLKVIVVLVKLGPDLHHPFTSQQLFWFLTELEWLLRDSACL